jgi:hypothetical protein
VSKEGIELMLRPVDGGIIATAIEGILLLQGFGILIVFKVYGSQLLNILFAGTQLAKLLLRPKGQLHRL